MFVSYDWTNREVTGIATLGYYSEKKSILHAYSKETRQWDITWREVIREILASLSPLLSYSIALSYKRLHNTKCQCQCQYSGTFLLQVYAQIQDDPEFSISLKEGQQLILPSLTCRVLCKHSKLCQYCDCQPPNSWEATADQSLEKSAMD